MTWVYIKLDENLQTYMKSIIRIIKSILIRLPLRNFILFESRPDFSDNSKYVYEEMIRRGLDKKYRMIWVCYDETVHSKIKSKCKTVFVKANTRLSSYYLIRAKVLISCNRFLESSSERQFSMFLAHGTAVKNVSNYYHFPKSIKYCLAASPSTATLRMKEFSIPETRVVPLGFPRNDLLTRNSVELHNLLNSSYDKIVIWLPTFRQNISGRKTGSNNAVPLLWKKENAILLNSFCEANNMLIVLKPHPAQDLSFFVSLDLSRVILVSDEFIQKNNIDLYTFISGSDALLTDYSSVYYDYTLCDKPIGLIWEDYDEYALSPGFAVDMEYMMRGGEKIYSMPELISFLTRVCKGEDLMERERREIRDLVNYSTDGSNSKRVVDFIIEKANL